MAIFHLNRNLRTHSTLQHFQSDERAHESKMAYLLSNFRGDVISSAKKRKKARGKKKKKGIDYLGLLQIHIQIVPISQKEKS